MSKKKNTEQVIATTMEQSRRLVSMGLPTTDHDMHWALHPVTQTWYLVCHPYDGVGKGFPAWSLGKLLQVAGAIENETDPVVLRERLVTFICNQLENGGGNHPQSEHRED